MAAPMISWERSHFRLRGLCVFVFHLLFHPGVGGKGKNSTGKIHRPRNRVSAHSWAEDAAMQWSVKDGRLFCGPDPVGVRRVVVEMVVGRNEGPVSDEKARHMIRMERAL